ncbi:Cytochrome P450 76C4-like protein [Drosera capensis]
MDAELSGFFVPENTQVLVNIWSIGRNESLWKNANVFEPEREYGHGHGQEIRLHLGESTATTNPDIDPAKALHEWVTGSTD